ncbi:phosphoribosyltransferase [bacterium]|nr:phosphoribosyltransferase [bacterium]
MFKNRQDAGKKLAEALSAYRDQAPLVLAIPRGGAPVGYEVAKALDADFSLLIVQKLPFPLNQQQNFGAIAEGGSVIVLGHASRNLDPAVIDKVIDEQIKEIKRRQHVLRTEQAIPPLTGRTIILVDEGIKIGVTMKAAIRDVSTQNPKKIIVASPVSSPEAAHAFEQMHAVDQVVILEKPRFFHDIAQVYDELLKVGDHAVLSLVHQWQETPA